MKYTKNINMFDKIDTEEKAYWLGMLMADGSIAWQKTKKGIKLYGIKFGLCDIDVMNKYKKFFDIGDNVPYQILQQEGCQPVYYLYINCHKIAEDLSKHGVIPNKTHRIQIPVMPKNMIRHFIRGYFDGDGCIYIRDRKLNGGLISKRTFVCITSCSDKILEQIETICKDFNLIRKNKSFIRYPKTYNNKQHPPFFGLNHRMDICNFLNFIYKDATIYMERKYNLYISIKDKLLYNKVSIKNKFFGVTYIPKNTKRPYYAQFEHNNIKHKIGYFKNEIDAAKAYNAKIIELNLPETMLNKIEEAPNLLFQL